MGNKCKPVSKFESKPLSRPLLTSSSEDKRFRKIQKRWEMVQKRYSSTGRPFECLRDQKPEKFKRYLSEGPPEHLRWEVWKAALGAGKKFVMLDTALSEDNYSIEKDLDRTFPNHSYFKSPRGRTYLRNVLVSMVNNHPELGYCQGMNSLAGVLLIVSANDLESYCLMESICFGFGGKGLFEYEFPLVVQLCQEFHRVLSEKMPDVHRFFLEIELDDNLWLTKWFMTLFSYSFHLDCVIRIWDCIFAYGLGFMVNIALGLIEFIKPEMLGKSLADMLEYLPELKEIMVDIDLVLFHGNKFNVRSLSLETPEGQNTSIDDQEVQDPIRTTWEVSTSSVQNSKSMMEEFSMCFSNNISKFSI
jgi:hypothetical protein